MSSDRAFRTLVFLIRVELVLWLLASNPLLPFSLLFGLLFAPWEPFGLQLFAAQMAVFFFLGVLFEQIRGWWFFPKGELVPEELVADLDSSLQGQGSKNFRSNRVRIVKTDLSLGAHVRGVIRPQIYLSGGLLIGLLDGANSARAIVAHELAHIQNQDRWVPGILALTLVSVTFNVLAPLLAQLGGPPRAILSSVGYGYLIANAVVLLMMASFILHRREYAADLVAATMIGSRRKYLDFLNSLAVDDPRGSSDSPLTPGYLPPSERRTFTHPSLNERKSAIAGNRLVIGPSRVLTLYWLFMVLASVLRTFEGDGLVDRLSAASTLPICLVGLFIELIRWRIVRRKPFQTVAQSIT
jgi:hypothetical protein